MEPISEIKKAIEDNKLIIGTKETVKKLKQSKVSKIFVSANCPDEVKEDLTHLCSIGKIELVDLSFPNTELGTICKKPFSISVVSLSKDVRL